MILALLGLKVQVVALVDFLNIYVAGTFKAVFYLAAAVCIVFIETQFGVLPYWLLLLFSSLRLFVSHFFRISGDEVCDDPIF